MVNIMPSQNLVSVLVLYVGTYVPISTYISPCIVLVDVTAASFENTYETETLNKRSLFLYIHARHTYCFKVFSIASA